MSAESSQCLAAGPKAVSGLRRFGRGLTLVVILGFVHLIVAATALQYLHQAGAGKLGDFDAFHLVGEMIWNGQAALAYDEHHFFDVQEGQWGNAGKFLWSYPPQFNFVSAILGLFPRWAAYLLFLELTFAAYLVVVRQLSGAHFHLVIAAILPFLLLMARTGQNGFLTGALVGWFLLAFQQRQARAGIPLGLMIVKPHLALGVGALSVISRSWKVLGVATLVVSASSAAATLVFGSGIWSAFLHGVGVSGTYLEAGEFKLFRMTSLYASLRSVGLSSDLAFVAQAGLALAAVAAIVGAWTSGWGKDRVLAVAALASMLISPYNQDYDMAIYGLAVALLVGDVTRFGTRLEGILLLVLSWITCGYGVLAHFATDYVPTYDGQPVSVSGVALLVIAALAVRIMWRAERGQAAVGSGDAVPAV